MKRGLICGLVLLGLTGASLPSSAASPSVYGEALGGAEVVRIAELTGSPEKYVGKTVRVTGLIEDVCPMKGCWIDILEGESGETVRFKVEDGIIVFPVEAKGREVVAEGVLQKKEMSERRARSWMRHLAEEKGEPFDEASVTGPMVFYQIEGIGAEVSR